MQDEYRDVIDSLNQAIDAENAYKVSACLKNTVSDIKDLKKKIYYLIKTASVCWIQQQKL